MYDYEPNEVLLYRALLGPYRDAFVEHVRTCMQLLYGANAEEELKSCFGNGGWENLKAKVSSAAARGAVDQSRVDEFDYLDVAYFYQVVDRRYEILVAPQWHPHRNRWMLVGDGGKGKTAIAYEFAREVIEAAPPGLCAAFWLSAGLCPDKRHKVVA